MTTALRLLLTRNAADCASWARELRARGHEPLEFPCVEIAELPSPKPSAPADWLVFTSARAVERWSPAHVADEMRIACVGARTAAQARARLGRCELVARPETGAALAAALHALWIDERPARAWRLLAPGAADGDRSLEREAAATGWRIERIALYEVRALPALDPRRDLAELELDAVLLASPSAARGLARRALLPAALPLACIGPTTAEAAREIPGARILAASEASLDGLLDTLRPPSRT